MRRRQGDGGGASRRHIKPPLARYAVKVEGRGQFFEDAIWPVFVRIFSADRRPQRASHPAPPVESIQTASIHKPKIKACTATIRNSLNQTENDNGDRHNR